MNYMIMIGVEDARLPHQLELPFIAQELWFAHVFTDGALARRAISMSNHLYFIAVHFMDHGAERSKQVYHPCSISSVLVCGRVTRCGRQYLRWADAERTCR